MWSYPCGAAGTLFFGYIFDILGRRMTIFFTVCLSSVILFFVTSTAPEIYPWLFIMRLGFQFMLAAPMSNPLPADYV